jgi:DNA-binding IclR family transcriptional regulator
MPIDTRKLQVLHILSKNLLNPNTQLVNSNDIAQQLNLSLPETYLLLKVMNDMGVIESNVDNQLSLITQKGMRYLEERQNTPPSVSTPRHA